MSGRVLLTGGAGFIGCNVAHRLLSSGREVVVLDDLSRTGVERNARWLSERHGDRFTLVRGDVRDRHVVGPLVERADTIIHLAAQVAVTTSLVCPTHDFEVNALGTVNVLECARQSPRRPILLYTSTNKVYGALPDVPLRQVGTRWVPSDPTLEEFGASEARPLDFHSPYGCSKGAADQYVLDFGRCFGMRTVVFRMSCIYGPRQFGTEDQGWVAHFLLRALACRGATRRAEGADGDDNLIIYGDGHQVRDILFVDDLVDAMLLAEEHIDEVAGRAFNIGGGPSRQTSLLELLGRMEASFGLRAPISYRPFRTGDQRWYVSDTRAFEAATGWRPRVGLQEGLSRLHGWLRTLVSSRIEATPRVSMGLGGAGLGEVGR